MKYRMGLVGILFACSNLWAAPEEMTMYATLSAPIASFWSVKTAGCDPVVMPNNSQLNLGFVTGAASNAAALGNINLIGNKPLSITKLYMQKNTKFQVSGTELSDTKWLVQTLNIAHGASATVGGGLIVNKLELPVTDTQEVTITVSSTLRLGSATQAQTGEFSKINAGREGNICSNGFCFDTDPGSSEFSATWRKVNCSINESNCQADTYWLVGEN